MAHMAALESPPVTMREPLNWSDLTEESQRLTEAQTARTVAAVCAEGVLSTVTHAPGIEGSPFSSYCPLVFDDQGHPLMPIASAETDTNLAKNPSATLYARAPSGGAASGSGLTLVGAMEKVSVDEVDDASLNRVSTITGRSVEEVAKAAWWRLRAERVHLRDAVREAEGWVPASEYETAEPNPLATAAASLLAKINEQHAPALRRFAAVYAGVPVRRPPPLPTR